jgi:glucose/arabinose dehydrogenase
MGIAVHPQFATNGYVYLFHTYGTGPLDAKNRLIRMKYANRQLTNPETLIDAIPATAIHKGGRIKFGPDGFLYITTGDTNTPSLSQDTNSLAGKILRVTDTGAAAPGNPFNNLVYSYGHRNPQGIAWDSSGQLWETEHGETALDELNKITMGANYGWPTIRGSQTEAGMVTPVLNSAQETWAPAGMAIIGNSLYFGGLRSEALFKVTLPNASNLQTYFKTGDPGRIRDVVVGPDGMLYISTTNFGHNPRPNDDKIYRINPNKL